MVDYNPAAIWLETVFENFDLIVTQSVHYLYTVAGDFFTPFFEFISFLGHDGIPLIILSLLLCIFKKTRRFGIAMAFSIAIGALITNCFLKVVIERVRPYAHDGSVYQQYWQLMGMHTESDNSFPSGHVTAAFATMTAVFLTGNKKYSWTAFIFGILMFISRIYLCVHHPSDCVVGVIVGLLAGCIGTLIASKLPRKVYGRDFYEIKFRLPDKSKIHDESHDEDYKASESVGRVTFGELGLYWKDLGKYYFCEYPYIENAFYKISECSEDEFSQSYSYYRLILEHAGKEFANLIIDKEEDAKKALNLVKEKVPLS